MLVLDVTPAEGQPFDVTVDEESLSIGRSTRCEITIPDRFLSRRHARLFASGDAWQIEDLGSRNGTFVNGRRVEGPTLVRPGDVIALSASLIKVNAGDGGDPPSDVITDAPPSDRLLRSAAELLDRTGTPPPGADVGDDSGLARYARRLALLNEVHQAMAESVALEDLLELVLEHITRQLEPERVEVFMRCGDGSYTCVGSRSMPFSSLHSLYSESLFAEVADKGMAALVSDTRSDDRFANAESLVTAGVRSLLAAPLTAPDGPLGLIVLGSNASIRKYSEEDLELLVILSSVTALRIHNLALTQEAAERHRLERELALARNIQVALLPQRLPEVAGYGLYGETRPSRGVSGDYYQVVERRDGAELVLALADVSGKGITAAIITGYLDAMVSVPIEDGQPPHEIFDRVSPELLRRTLPSQFATMFLGVLDPASGTLRFASAGHTPGCLIRASGAVEWLASTGMPLGLMSSARYELDEARLDAGDTLVLYSDGYTEAENLAGEEFGQARLAEICSTHHDLPPGELAAEIDRALESYAAGTSFIDDRTIVVIKRDD